MSYPSNDYRFDPPITPLPVPDGPAEGPEPSQQVYEAGHRRHPRARALAVATTHMQNLRVPMRDGANLRIDVFLPAEATEQVPAIVCWSPYGKSDSVFELGDFPFRIGIARSAVSDFQSWEGLDPAEWCGRGYAVVNVDIRGTRHADGVMQFWNHQQAIDGYDTIEWLAAQDWCNGRVGMAGNSWLAIAQWFIAATRPPHLSAIAPWEGFTDVYRHHIARGGIPDPGFTIDVINRLSGRNGLANPVAKLERDQLYSEGWADYAARVEDITVPVSVVASWTNFLHSEGTLDAYNRLAVDRKWLRVHNAFEWSDYYDPKSVDDLALFFDCYLKGESNAWETTPRCRLTMIDPGGSSIVERPEKDYPPARFKPHVLHLHADGTLRDQPQTQQAELRYRPSERGKLNFRYQFASETETCGPMRLSFDLAVEGASDADLYATIRWLKPGGSRPRVRTMQMGLIGNTITNLLDRAGSDDVGMVFYKGPNARLRASRRHLDSTASSEVVPVHTFDREEQLSPGEIVRVDIAIPPAGLRWHKGDTIELTIAGHGLYKVPLPNIEQPKLICEGQHILQFGSDHPATLTMLAAPFQAHLS